MQPKTATTQTAQLPKVEHFAALVDSSFSYSDDNADGRVRNSTSTFNSIEYIVLGDADAAIEWVRAREEAARTSYGRQESYRIVRVNPVEVERQVSFSIK
jgi:hypothetical protein